MLYLQIFIAVITLIGALGMIGTSSNYEQRTLATFTICGLILLVTTQLISG